MYSMCARMQGAFGSAATFIDSEMYIVASFCDVCGNFSCALELIFELDLECSVVLVVSSSIEALDRFFYSRCWARKSVSGVVLAIALGARSREKRMC